MAWVTPDSVTAGQIRGCIESVSGQYLTKLQLFDVYSGEGVESGRKSLALGLTFQDSSRTLTDDDIEGLVSEVLSDLKQKLNASLRE